LIKRTLRSWGQDRLLWGIIKNSGYLFSSNSAAVVLTAVQGILAARLLGVEGYGVLAATIIPFVSNINRLLSFRMSELVVKYVGQYLVEGRKDRAAAVVKGAALVEAGTAVLAFGVLIAASPHAANLLAKDPGAAPFFTLYGIIILTNAFYETSVGVLQVSRLFNRIALVNFHPECADSLHNPVGLPGTGRHSRDFACLPGGKVLFGSGSCFSGVPPALRFPWGEIGCERISACSPRGVSWSALQSART
jgi:hypothetical protein